MKPEFECAVAAGFLRSGQVLSNCANCAALIAAGGALLAHAPAARLLFTTSVLCWPAGCYFAMRVAIDARLFCELGREGAEGGQALDEVLHAWGLANPKPGRTVAERSRGALRLWRRQMAAVAVQLAAMAAGLLALAWSG